ncbi:hypothetical protein [Labedella phragmitis]|uniref:hypothetical protein n=1 Tax=Labedella phragmitis TaxID=2498849 RepID=UPI00140D25FE|nr:hypothetical protein [Labedella phragmitis]
MDPRRLGALQPTRLSASRAFIATMVRDGWRIEQDQLEVDRAGNGRARYTVITPQGAVTFLAFLREPAGGNRTSRIIGTSWDMIGSLIDGIADDAQVHATETEIDKLYEGRAPVGTLVWFRSNQSLRIFEHVRRSLADGRQPDLAAIRKVGYLMRNTGLDGNGTFGTTSFKAIPAGHPLATSYFAQMLAAYLMRELAVDLVQELARLDNPAGAVRLSIESKRAIGVGNGSALGLVMFVYNRPLLINAYALAYLEALEHVLTAPIAPGDARFDRLEELIDRAIAYRATETTQYRVFTGAREHAADLRRIRTVVRAARRGDIVTDGDETPLAAVHRYIRGRVSPDAEASLNSLLLELIPEYCDRLVAEKLVFDETLTLDPALPVARVAELIDTRFGWALELPLNDERNRDRVWYQSRAAEEPRSGPREEVPGAHEVIADYPGALRALRALLTERPADEPLGFLLSERPDLMQITELVLSLADAPYAVPHADPHDTDFVPAWVVRLMNSFVHGLDRTEDYLNRVIRGLIFEGAPYREELATADASAWWWVRRQTTPAPVLDALADIPTAPPVIEIKPSETLLVAPEFPAGEHLVLKYREARLVAGRAMQALNLPAGSWHAARDFFVTALLADPAAVDAFGDLLAGVVTEAGSTSHWSAPTTNRTDAATTVDGGGQSLLVLGHVLLSLLGALAADKPAEVTLTDLQHDSALPGLILGLARLGVAAEADVDDDGTVVLRIRRDKGAGDGGYAAALEAFIRDGIPLPARSWWRVYFPAHAGMYPDSDLSRQHTGTTIKDFHKPGQQITSQFEIEELMGLEDPDDSDNQSDFFAATGRAQ